MYFECKMGLEKVVKCCTISYGFDTSDVQQLHVSCFLISLQMDTKDMRKCPFFPHFLIRLPSKKCLSASVCEPGWCWTLVLLDTRQGMQHGSSHPPFRWPVWLSSDFHFSASYSLPATLASRAGTLYCQRFFFNLCILITTSSISEGWMFWDNKMLPRITLLPLPLDSSINGMLLISRTKLSWFLYNLNLFSLKPLVNFLPISRDTKLSQMSSGRDLHIYWNKSKVWGV